jgi:hypothetical protein
LFAFKKHNCVIISLALLVAIGAMLCSGFGYDKKSAIRNLPDSLYVGSQACRRCHQAIYDSFLSTAHNLTSVQASGKFIKGSFDPERNHFSYNKFMEVVLEKKNDSYFQTSYINGLPLQSESFDIVIGSGRKGQTYLYWKDDQLFQLPVSYSKRTDSWCNSPGYPVSMARFDRVIPANCLECHGSFAKFDQANNITFFNKTSIVYGVNCERCHGPAARHVNFHLQNPQEKTGYFISTKKTFTRQQSLDVCALCHGGVRQALKPPFSFVAGDKLTDFSVPTYNEDSAALLDVHGNQYGLLMASKCFKQSEMNCASCHNVHKEEINVPALYSSRCMNCHNEASHKTCTLPQTTSLGLSNNCIDCHMPVLPSKKIFLQSNDPDKSSPDFVRTHLISIYPEITKQFIQKASKSN